MVRQVTYRLESIDSKLDLQAQRENYKELQPNEKLRCSACNSIYWRLFYDRAICMGCRSITRLRTESGGVYRCHDLRDVSWIRWQVNKFRDGRVRDPITKRSEFIIFRHMLKSRVGGTEFLIHPQIKGTWYYGKLEEHFKTMTPNQIMAFLHNSLEDVRPRQG